MDLVARAAFGFVIALVCTPAGVSGAFLLLPVQIQVFSAPSPVVSATNLVYNVIATPAGAATFHRHGRLDRHLAVGLIAGTTPGVVAGVALRSTWLASEFAFAWIAGILLIGMGARLAVSTRRSAEPAGDDTAPALATGRLVLIGSIGGAIGGIYGFGGAALIVPWLVSVEHQPMRRVAGAGLVTTMVTSVVGLAAFAAAAALGVGEASAPDWAAGTAFGLGGAAGAILGARLQPRIPVRLLRGVLGAVAVAAGIRTLL